MAEQTKKERNAQGEPERIPMRRLPKHWGRDWKRAYSILTTEGAGEAPPKGWWARLRALYRGVKVKLTPARRALFVLCLILALLGADKEQDGPWHLVAFAIPETKRAARDGLRDQLRSLGGALLQNGIYVSPHGWEPQVRAAAERLGVDEHLTTATTEDLQVGGERDPRELARRLWNIDELAQRYGQFVESYEDVPERLEDMRSHRERLTDADFQPGALWIGVQFGECFQNDPLLPPELLPRPWPGRKARYVLARCRRLGMLIREENQAPPLFQMWDDVIRALP